MASGESSRTAVTPTPRRLGALPTFCRHNRFAHRCPICAKEQAAPVTRSGGRPAGGGATRPKAPARSASAGSRAGGSSLRVRREARGVDDGYRTDLAPGLRSSADAARLAEEVGFAAARLARLGGDPPGLYAEAALDRDPEEAIWLPF